MPPVGAGFHPGFDRAFRQRRVAIRHDQLLIVAENISEALTLGTGAKRVIERKHDRADGFERPRTSLAHKPRAIPVRTLSNDVDTAGPVSLTQGVLDGLHHPASVVGDESPGDPTRRQVLRPCR